MHPERQAVHSVTSLSANHSSAPGSDIVFRPEAALRIQRRKTRIFREHASVSHFLSIHNLGRQLLRFRAQLIADQLHSSQPRLSRPHLGKTPGKHPLSLR